MPSRRFVFFPFLFYLLCACCLFLRPVPSFASRRSVPTSPFPSVCPPFFNTILSSPGFLIIPPIFWSLASSSPAGGGWACFSAYPGKDLFELLRFYPSCFFLSSSPSSRSLFKTILSSSRHCHLIPRFPPRFFSYTAIVILYPADALIFNFAFPVTACSRFSFLCPSAFVASLSMISPASSSFFAALFASRSCVSPVSTVVVVLLTFPFAPSIGPSLLSSLYVRTFDLPLVTATTA